MKKNFNVPFLDTAGKPTSESGEDVTLAKLVVVALQNARDNATIDGAEKYKRYKLIEKISEANEVEISVEEAATIKTCVGSTMAPMALGRIYDLLEA